MRYWLVAHPDISRAIGGVKQMHRLAECISRVGREATLIQEDASFHPGWFESNVSTISFKDWLSLRNSGSLNPSRDIVIVPETYIGGVFEYVGKLPIVLFNQNGAYSFGADHRRYFKPDSVISRYRDPRILHVFCVSQSDKNLLVDGFKLNPEDVTWIHNSIEVDTFRPNGTKVPRMALMPRKNPMDVAVVQALLRQQSWMDRWELVQIVSQPHKVVVDILQRSLLFLSFGHPEGFGLPVAEAMACGCAVVGYSGLGGRELFQIGASYRTVEEVAVGDWLGFVNAARRIDQQLKADSNDLVARLLQASNQIRRHYSIAEMEVSVRMGLSRIESKIAS